MSILAELRRRFGDALAPLVDPSAELLEMIRPAQDARFGDYQANCAMPLGKQLGQPPREIAQQLVENLRLDDLCEPPEIAGPGFINLRLRSDWLIEHLRDAFTDPRVGVSPVSEPWKVVIDYSSPNVAKPMHVGHIRSTVIGDALARTLRFLGHEVITDNHLGDWGTQFGMIIYGYKHFVDPQAYAADPVRELGRLYKYVNQLVEYHAAQAKRPKVDQAVDNLRAEWESAQAFPVPEEKAAAKQHRRRLNKLETEFREAQNKLTALEARIQQVDSDATLSSDARQHPQIGAAVLEETAKLHAGDAENRRLWEDFLPACRAAIQSVYQRLDIHFDHELGESYYQDQLAQVVEDLIQQGLARKSEGAICVFLKDFEAPMIVQKRDGAFLYATTDLATVLYRMKTWNPDVILYVVDHRQGEHFDKLFAVCRSWGFHEVDFRHISFGTVLGKDGRPYKTRSGDVVNLDYLLDEAVDKAYSVVCEQDDAKKSGPELDEAERRNIAHVVGHAAVKYADLSHNRTSDYKFELDKMVALEGNTASYMQYSYARTQAIFRRGQVDVEQLRQSPVPFQLVEPAERELAKALLQFSDALEQVIQDYRPNELTSYLYELASLFHRFYSDVPVLKAGSDALRNSRCQLCDLSGRVIQQGLSLLGIEVVPRM